MLKAASHVFVIFILTLQAFGSEAGDKSFFAARREALMKKIQGSIAVLEGAADTYAYETFRQSNDFYYLTGVETPGAYLIIDAVRHRSTLFLPARNRTREIWEGPRLYPGEEARTLTGCEEVLPDSRLQGELENTRKSARIIYTPTKPEETAAVSRDRAVQSSTAQEQSLWDGRVSRAKAFGQNLKKRLGDSIDLKDLSPILDDMRRVKDTLEIERMREAGRIGALGMTEAIRAAKPGLYEYQIAAVADFVFRWHGAAGPAYFPVVGSGPNSCVLHYHDNTRKLEAGDLVVMDFGPDYRFYESDITRTFPVSGKFSDEQARIYRVVLEAQKAAIETIRPGATFREIGAAARQVVEHAGYIKYWQHGVSHYIGMSTHDVGDMRPLELGVVITVEPGIYLAEKKTGVRIEDTILVTKDGCEILSKGVPKEIFEIERLRAEQSAIAPR